ncbi:hypothetical protein J6590_086152 [Homalodisca vitripennis]|nr:hypothetical protein J6590_086152 [Homalodisca vitripennis]
MGVQCSLILHILQDNKHCKAVRLCNRIILSTKRRMPVVSGSQVRLRHVSSCTCVSKVAIGCIILALTIGNKVTLMWVPRHEGIVGNETADRLASVELYRDSKFRSTFFA